MKKIILVVIVFLASFSAEAQESWREWQDSNCYERIDFRIKYEGKKGSREEWKIQFKNEYNSQVTFNYGVTEEEGAFLSTHRKTLNPQEVSEPVSFYTDTKNFYVLVDKLSFSLYQEELIPCEN